MASANQIRQVMLNVIKNAKESMPSGGTLFVRTMPSAGNVRIIIRDTGVGIPEALQDKIFEAFFTTKQKGSGNGLGLCLAQTAVTRLGGSLELRNEPAGGACAEMRALRSHLRSGHALLP